jgi:OPT family oligopeptide transporter
VQQILTNGTFDAAKYSAYSPLLMSSAGAIAYGLAFASFAAVLVHTFIWYRHDIVRRFRHSLKDETDIHSRLMQAYPEVPQLWYGILGVTALVVLIVVVAIYPTELPVWALLLSLLLAAIVSVPTGMLQAVTNQPIMTQVVDEVICGYMLPGRPIANMIFKATAFVPSNQAVAFSSNLKLGHYMKVPPRIMFTAQVVAAFVCCFVVTLVQDWMFSNIPDFCTHGQTNGFSCPSTSTFASASMIWGGVGPGRLFSPDKMCVFSPRLT